MLQVVALNIGKKLNKKSKTFKLKIKEKEQSSIEWLEWQINLGLSERGLISAFKEAKAMHKEEVQDAYREGRTDQQSSSDSFYNRNAESYYNETFGG